MLNHIRILGQTSGHQNYAVYRNVPLSVPVCSHCCVNLSVSVKLAKQSNYRPGQALRLLDFCPHLYRLKSIMIKNTLNWFF
jgi:hypothetical protein